MHAGARACKFRHARTHRATYTTAKVGVCPVGLVETVLPLHHHTQMLIVQNDHLHIQLLYRSCRQLLAVHQEGAIAIDVDHHLRATEPMMAALMIS